MAAVEKAGTLPKVGSGRPTSASRSLVAGAVPGGAGLPAPPVGDRKQTPDGSVSGTGGGTPRARPLSARGGRPSSREKLTGKDVEIVSVVDLKSTSNCDTASNGERRKSIVEIGKGGTLPHLLRRRGSKDDVDIRFKSSDNLGSNLGELSLSNTPRAERLSQLSNEDISEVKTTLKAAKLKDVDTGTKYLNQYQVIETLGKGSFGKVKLAVTEDGSKYAIKIVRRQNMKKKRFGLSRVQQDNPYEKLKKEVAVMKKLSHPHVVKLHEVIDDESMDRIFIVMTYCAKGELMKLKGDETVKSIDENERWQLFRELTSAVAYLHSKGILHRDIKPENMLLDENGLLQLADFGVSLMFKTSDLDSDNIFDNYGTPSFTSPEGVDMSSDGVSGRMEDVWAMGITLYAMAYGRVPFYSENILELHNMITKQAPEIPEGTDPLFKNLLEGILEKKPEKRLTLEQISKHEWVTKGGKFPLAIPIEVQEVTVTQQDISKSITMVDRFSLLIKMKTQMARKARQARDRLIQPNGSIEEDENKSPSPIDINNYPEPSGLQTPSPRQSEGGVNVRMNGLSAMEEGEAIAVTRKRSLSLVAQGTPLIPSREIARTSSKISYSIAESDDERIVITGSSVDTEDKSEVTTTTNENESKSVAADNKSDVGESKTEGHENDGASPSSA